jgi:hypothetical protein
MVFWMANPEYVAKFKKGRSAPIYAVEAGDERSLLTERCSFQSFFSFTQIAVAL